MRFFFKEKKKREVFFFFVQRKNEGSNLLKPAGSRHYNISNSFFFHFIFYLGLRWKGELGNSERLVSIPQLHISPVV